MLDKNTKIHSVYSEAQTPSELIGELVYSWNQETKLIEISKILSVDELVYDGLFLEILLDSEQKIRCTLDHLFYTFRAKPMEAKNLPTGKSIRAFTLSLAKDGHYRVNGFVNGKAQHQYVARMVWEYHNGKIEGDQILHHIDFDKLNNKLDNLKLLSNSMHNSVHYPYRKDGGFFRKNHKVKSISLIEQECTLIDIKLDKNQTVVIADDVSVSGIKSGVIVNGACIK